MNDSMMSGVILLQKSEIKIEEYYKELRQKYVSFY